MLQLNQNKNYTLQVESALLIFKTNEALAKILTDYGFTNVQVTGVGAKRKATGHWPHPAKPLVIDKTYQGFIKNLQEV